MKKYLLIFLILIVIFISACNSTSDWKAYQNDMFSIKYPSSYQLTEDGNKGLSLDGKTEGQITVRYFGDDLNFGDTTLEYPKRVKMGLDQFMEVAKRNDAFKNIKKTEFNGYKAYEIDFSTKVSNDGGETYKEENAFLIMTENSKGHVYQIGFKNKPTKKDLTSTEIEILSTFQFN